MAYGMTEAIGITALDGDEWLQHEGSVGRGFRGTEVRILDDDGNELPPGEIGEIYLRGPGLRRVRLPRRGAPAAARPTTASTPSATWATSTRTATSTSSTAAST